MRAIATGSELASGRISIPRSMLTPTQIAFATVPIPSCSRSGIHSRSSTKLTAMLIDPTVAPSRSARAAWKTSQGAPPSPERSSIASDSPKPVSPIIICTSRRPSRSTPS